MSKWHYHSLKQKWQHLGVPEEDNERLRLSEKPVGSPDTVNDAFYKIRHLFVHARKAPRWDYSLAGWLYTWFPHHVVEVYRILHGKM